MAGSLGILAAFLVLTRGFLRLGESNRALTIPQWIFYRYNHRGFSLFFAFLNLLSVTFVVLILVGCSLLLTGLFPLDQKSALIAVLVFVFSYVLMGGTYAHAYTNALQGIMMLLVTLLLFVEGFKYFGGDILASLRSVGSDYAAASLVPVLFGVLVRRPVPLWVVAVPAALGLATHLALNLLGGMENPAVSATWAIGGALACGVLGVFITRPVADGGGAKKVAPLRLDNSTNVE